MLVLRRPQRENYEAIRAKGKGICNPKSAIYSKALLYASVTKSSSSVFDMIEFMVETDDENIFTILTVNSDGN